MRIEDECERVMVMIGVRGWTGVFFLPVVKKSGIMLYAAMYSRLVYSSCVALSANREPSWDSGTCSVEASGVFLPHTLVSAGSVCTSLLLFARHIPPTLLIIKPSTSRHFQHTHPST
jgi:hypothetical protein